MTSKLKPHETGALLANAGLIPQKQQAYVAGSKTDKELSRRLAIAERQREFKRQYLEKKAGENK